MNQIINFFKDEEGATMVEYALMLSLIAVVCIAAVIVIGQNASDTFTEVGNQMPGTGT
jgi:pilus assembly protein Flp/PilA